MTSRGDAKARAGRACVVYITDGRPDDQCRMVWSLRSLLRSAPSGYDVFVLSDAPVDGVRLSLSRDIGDVGFTHVSDMYPVLQDAGLSRAGWNRQWPFEVLYRLGIPLHPVFAEYDRALYLDTDTVVLSDRVADFMQADLSGFEVGGVPDTAQEAHGRISAVLYDDLPAEHAERLVADHGQALFTRSYVNAGVLLFNLREIRRALPWYRERLSMFWAAECRGKMGFLDQDFVNVMMRVRSDFSLVFNWFNVCGSEADSCVIRHFCARRYADMARCALERGLL